MHAHAGEVVTEAWLHEGTSRQIEALAGRAQYFVDDGRCYNLSRVVRLDVFRLKALLFLKRLLRPAFGVRSTGDTSTLDLWLRHPHHLLGDVVCFLLILVSWLVELELPLKHW